MVKTHIYIIFSALYTMVICKYLHKNISNVRVIPLQLSQILNILNILLCSKTESTIILDVTF